MKQFDVVVLGSTGFTGRLVCKHIVQSYHGKGQLKWAMAGRSKAKMEEVKASLAQDGHSLADVAILEADVTDQASLNALAASTSVVITLAGPYARFGRPVVQACIENGAHYCDLTGEAQFIRRTMDEFDAAAKAKGVRIVHSCGFDSVPSEVLTLQAAHHMATVHNKLLGEVTVILGNIAEGFASGGTTESFVTYTKDRLSSPEVDRIMSHPYCLIPNFQETPNLLKLPDKGGLWWPVWSQAAECWSGPFIMAIHNEKIVRMSNALLGWKYGKQMIYSERDGTSLFAAVLKTMLMYAAATVMWLAAKFEWVRARLPQPGEGATDAQMEKGHFEMNCWALPDTSGGNQGEPAERVHSKFADKNREGGYWSTSRMLLESALCMIPQNEKLLAQDPYARTCPAGVLTPSAALGLVLHDRLKNAGYELSVADVDKKTQ